MPYDLSATIVAVSTPAGKSPLGIVRISGAAAIKIAAQVFHREKTSGDKRGIYRGEITWENAEKKRAEKFLAPALLAIMRAPRSYTGEDVAEFFVAGAPILLNTLVTEICRHGARRASAGEFTWRALMRGRLTLNEVTAVSHLIQATNDATRREAIGVLRSGLQRKITAWRERLQAQAALVEAELDFAETEIDRAELAALPTQLRELAAECAQVIAQSARHHRQRRGFSIGLIGLTNAGKSSLFNRLLQSDVALVAAEKSTTRDQLTHNVTWENFTFTLTDCPGEDFSPTPIAQQLRARNQRTNYDFSLLLVVVDLTDRAATKNFLQNLPSAIPRIVVGNKLDLLPPDFVADELTAINVSAITGLGIENLRAQIGAAILRDTHTESTLPEMELAALTAVAQNIAAAHAELANGNYELTAFELRGAYQALTTLSGESYSEEMLKNIFARFCIGK